MMADTCRGSLQFDQAAGGVAMNPPTSMGRYVVEERVAHEAVAESIARARGVDDQCPGRSVEGCGSPPLRQARQGDELVGVERRPDDRHPLEHLTRRWSDATDHVGV